MYRSAVFFLCLWLATAKFGADYGGGDGDVEGVGGGMVVGRRRDGDAMADVPLELGADALPFAAHQNDAAGGERMAVDAPTAGVGSVDADAGGYGGEPLAERDVVQLYVGHGSHGGLDGFRSKDVGAAWAANDVLNAEPVGYANYGAQVAWILHSVEDQDYVLLRIDVADVEAWNMEDGNDLRRRGHQAEAGEAAAVEGYDLIGHYLRMAFYPGRMGEKHAAGIASRHAFDGFIAFHDEGAVEASVFLVLQGAEELESAFGQHFCG